MSKHVDFTPKPSFQEASRCMLELASDIRALVSGDTPNQLDWGCRATACGIVIAYGGELSEPPAPGARASCSATEAAAILEDAAKCCKNEEGRKAFDWKQLLTIVMMILQGMLPAL